MKNEMKSVAINRTFSLTMTEIHRLAELEQLTGRNKSDLVREAIEHLYSQFVELQKNT